MRLYFQYDKRNDVRQERGMKRNFLTTSSPPLIYISSFHEQDNTTPSLPLSYPTPSSYRTLVIMGRQQAFWGYFRQVRRSAWKAQPQVSKFKQAWDSHKQEIAFLTTLGVLVGAMSSNYHNWASREQMEQRIEAMEEQTNKNKKEFEQQTQEYLDKMLKKIVTASYEPEGPVYVDREQDTDLQEDLQEYVESGGASGFFMLIGDSGSGKTTMMRHRLREDYKEGVLEVTLTASNILKCLREKSDPVYLQIEEEVLKKFGEKCWKHKDAHNGFNDFIRHANKVRMEAKKAEQVENAHPLIIYINLEIKDDLDYETLIEFADGFGAVATMLSSKTNSCKTIVEFSKSAISDHVMRLRYSDQRSLEVNAMTEDEFLKIGPQFLGAEDLQDLKGPYLKHYHDWLGGHTKTLVSLAEEGAEKMSMYRFCCHCAILIDHTLSSQFSVLLLKQRMRF